MKRRYYGGGRGIPEDPARCIAEVENPEWGRNEQCSRKRKAGPRKEFCKQHADMLADGRRVRVPKLK